VRPRQERCATSVFQPPQIRKIQSAGDRHARPRLKRSRSRRRHSRAMPLAGEKGRSVLEMTWSRPTCEINGMGGAYQGAGFKTVIPSTASAKVSFRLVFDQDPHAIRAAVRDFVRKRVSADCKVEFTEHGAGRAFAMRSPRSGGVQPSSSAVADQFR
jgi:acetylornithine deacetylase/succinyl-diaminopimelate desuccinylase-like protein